MGFPSSLHEIRTSKNSFSIHTAFEIFEIEYRGHLMKRRFTQWALCSAVEVFVSLIGLVINGQLRGSQGLPDHPSPWPGGMVLS